MTNNVMTTLTCETSAHGEMQKLIAQPSPPLGSAAFTLWVCPDCGLMALHLESAGDIHWYTPHAKTHPHRAGCAYCPTRFDCACGNPGARHMCVRCDDAAEESKMGVRSFPTGDPGEAAAEARTVHIFPQGLHRDPLDDPEDDRRGPF